MKDEPPNIVVQFVGPGGETTESMMIAPSDARPREFNEIEWDRERTLREFLVYLKARDGDGLQATMRSLDRLDCWTDALGQLLGEPAPDETLGSALIAFWITYGFHIGESLKGDLILVDLLKHLLPSYTGAGLKLYRGELARRYQCGVYGFSWTPHLSVAQMFASRRIWDEGEGVVLEVDATPFMIVTGPREHTHHLGEIEYVLDPRTLGNVIRIVL